MADFDAGTLDAGGNLSEQRKLTLLRRQNMTTEELEAEEEEDRGFLGTSRSNENVPFRFEISLAG